MSFAQGLEIRDFGGAYLGGVTHFTSGQWTRSVNQADRIEFTMPLAEAEKEDFVDHGNVVWLRRGDSGELARKFIITSLQSTVGARAETTIVGYDFISYLNRVAVTALPDEALIDTDVNIKQYLIDLLKLQSLITWGTFPRLETSTLPYDDLRVENSTVLESLHRLRDYLGGMLWVDNNNKLHWYTERFPNSTGIYSFDLDRNMIGGKVTVDALDIDHVISYEIDVVDLSQVSGEDDGMLEIGMPVTLTLTGDTLYITDITQDLHNPLACKVAVSSSLDLSGRKPDVVDAIVSIADDVSELDRELTILEDRVDVIDEFLTPPDGGVVDLIEGIVDDAVPPAVDDAIAALYGSDIQTVSNANSAGDSAQLARVNHKHSVFETVPTFSTTKFIPWFAMAQVVGLGVAGDLIACKLYNWATSAWETSITNVYKPYVLTASSWNDETITYTDGFEADYDDESLEIKYQRRATFIEGAEYIAEVQEITEAYYAGEVLWVMKAPDGYWYDMNVAGRHWALAVDQSDA